MKSKRLRIGDVIRIPLPKGKKTFAHFLYKDKWGDIVVVHDYLVDSTDEEDLEAIIDTKIKFGPILTRLKVGMNLAEFDWDIVGNIPVIDFKYPNFIWKEGANLTAGITTRWYLYDGETNKLIGQKLPVEYKKLEYLANYSPQALINRIVTGNYLEKGLIEKG